MTTSVTTSDALRARPYHRQGHTHLAVVPDSHPLPSLLSMLDPGGVGAYACRDDALVPNPAVRARSVHHLLMGGWHVAAVRDLDLCPPGWLYDQWVPSPPGCARVAGCPPPEFVHDVARPTMRPGSCPGTRSHRWCWPASPPHSSRARCCAWSTLGGRQGCCPIRLEGKDYVPRLRGGPQGRARLGVGASRSSRPVAGTP